MLTRLQRYLADCGIASRRACEAMIAEGRVRVNGTVRAQMPVMIDPEKDVVTVDDQTIGSGSAAGAALQEQRKVYYLLNKPKGILVTNSDPSQRKTVGELMTGIQERVFPVGRLDMDSRGALLMTNDGELANRLTHPRHGIEKTYIVEVDGRVGHEDLEKIRRGMWLGPEHPGGQGATRTDRFRLKLVGRERGRTIIELTLSETKNREIRRVMARLGHPVRDLNRVAIAGKVTIKGLDVGAFRPLREDEVKWLFRASSPEFHSRKQAETQRWYEAKEIEKERKRLAREEAEPKERPEQAKPERAREAKPERLRPARKGRKPFIPPSGRNAGKMLGGNEAGRRRVQDSGGGDEAPPRGGHPLGDGALGDD